MVLLARSQACRLACLPAREASSGIHPSVPPLLLFLRHELRFAKISETDVSVFGRQIAGGWLQIICPRRFFPCMKVTSRDFFKHFPPHR